MKLNANEITQEEYDQKVKELEGNKNTDISEEMKEYIAKLIQSETDKVRTKYAKELTEKDDKIKKMEADLKQSLSAKDLAEYEFKQEKELFEKERAEFQKAKMENEASKMLNKYGFIDDEDSTFMHLVKADTVEDMELRCQKLRKCIDNNVKTQVDERFKSSGRDINGSGSATNKNTESDFGKSLAQARTVQSDASKASTDYYFGNN